MATEERLIDANKIPYHQSGFPKGDGFDSGLDWAFREDIEKLPIVDAVEVVHGRWRIIDFKGNVECSECGYTMDLEYKYCPNCGAKMDGDGNG